MALFNKWFASRKKTDIKYQDNVCDKLFTFSNDQVRVILFRECDFRGRKLLFDSCSIQKVPMNRGNVDLNKNPLEAKFVELSDNFGYVYTKPKSDIVQLEEMVFGSVAMSYRGTSYKIHSFSTPSRLMCTQVFPSPKQVRGRKSTTSQSCNQSSTTSSSLEQSIRFDDSGTSSITSFSEHLSVNSSASDTLLVCRHPRSVPLDVPTTTGSTNIPNGDSGFLYEQSGSSLSSGPQSAPIFHTLQNTLSCGSMYKRWLRSTNNSLEHSLGSLTGSVSGDEYFSKPHGRASKLGLAVIVELSQDQERKLEEFLMEHAALVESMVWRARQGTESAYMRPNNFVSLMCEVTRTVTQWFMDLLSGTYLLHNMWQTLSFNCDNPYSIKYNTCFSVSKNSSAVEFSGLNDLQNTLVSDGSSCYESVNSLDKGSEFNLLNLTKFFKAEWDLGNGKKIASFDKKTGAEQFVREFCELLDKIDAKHTNFFMSTLITAVLTHHLGWVSTVFPLTEAEKEVYSKENSGNPFWGQLIDLYGATGFPTKVCHTIITGLNNEDIILRILSMLTYFIRCNDISKPTAVRVDVEEENKTAEEICISNQFIPKENFKKYEDHLREMAEASNFLNQKIKKNQEKPPEQQQPSNDFLKTTNLVKSKSCLSNLSESTTRNSLSSCNSHAILDQVTNLGLQAVEAPLSLNINNLEINKMEKFRNSIETQNLIDIKEASEQIKKVFSPKNLESDMNTSHKSKTDNFNSFVDDGEIYDNSNVLFLLGDGEELVGLSRDKNKKLTKSTNLKDDVLKLDSIQELERPTHLNLTKLSETSFEKEFQNSIFKDSDFIQNVESTIKPSSSFTCLNGLDTKPPETSTSFYSEEQKHKEYARSQSMPPENKPIIEDTKTKYRYAGVKFNFQQYPQILTNYMKSKNIELSHLTFSEKTIEFKKLPTKFDFSSFDGDFEEIEPLQTPSNATELEFTSDLIGEAQAIQSFTRNISSETKSTVQETNPTEILANKLKAVEIPMPKSSEISYLDKHVLGYTSTLMRGLNDHYISDMVLQGVSAPKHQWESTLKRDLVLCTKHSFLDQPVEEAIAIVANVNTWEVQLISSHTYVVDKGSSGITVGMSQLVANMLESLLHMWRLQTPPEYCLMHIEQKLQEFCLRSKALAQLLLATEFCSMELLTSTLQLEINDVPLLMAIASTHTPQIMQKYGLSFQ